MATKFRFFLCEMHSPSLISHENFEIAHFSVLPHHLKQNTHTIHPPQNKYSSNDKIQNNTISYYNSRYTVTPPSEVAKNFNMVQHTDRILFIRLAMLKIAVWSCLRFFPKMFFSGMCMKCKFI